MTKSCSLMSLNSQPMYDVAQTGMYCPPDNTRKQPQGLQVAKHIHQHRGHTLAHAPNVEGALHCKCPQPAWIHYPLQQHQSICGRATVLAACLLTTGMRQCNTQPPAGADLNRVLQKVQSPHSHTHAVRMHLLSQHTHTQSDGVTRVKHACISSTLACATCTVRSKPPRHAPVTASCQTQAPLAATS